MQLLSLQIKPCLPSVLDLKIQVSLTVSLSSFFFTLMMTCESGISKVSTEMLPYIFYFPPWFRDIAKHESLLRSWLYTVESTGSHQHLGPGLWRCKNKGGGSSNQCCSRSYSCWSHYPEYVMPGLMLGEGGTVRMRSWVEPTLVIGYETWRWVAKGSSRKGTTKSSEQSRTWRCPHLCWRSGKMKPWSQGL